MPSFSSAYSNGRQQLKGKKMPERNVISLQGKTAFISGASKGIGSEIARNLAQAGARLALTGRSRQGLIETRSSAESFGVDVWIGTADLSDAAQVRSVARAALDDLGHVDVLVNNAGVAVHDRLLDIDMDDWDRTYNVDVIAPLIFVQEFVPGMIERGHGKVINVTSRAALAGHAGMAAYSSAKAALHQLSRTMAVEFGPHNVQVNCIAPTVTMTAMGRKSWPAGSRTDAKLARIPAGRFAEPVDVAYVTLFLASGLSDFVNGTIVPVDGGEGAG
jgi:NAD(P)-dependent dehydrogenase (short-subunit alcohol dehydrogenase family)